MAAGSTQVVRVINVAPPSRAIPIAVRSKNGVIYPGKPATINVSQMARGLPILFHSLPGIVGTPGPPGPPGAAAYTTLTQGFTMPPINGTVLVTCLDTSWMTPNQSIYVGGAGYFTAQQTLGNQAMLVNTGSDVNLLPGASIPAPQGVSPAGVQGGSGSQGATGPVGPAGPQGNPGTGIIYRGTWAGGTAYNVNDSVTYAGSSWVALKPTTGVTPGTDPTAWAIFAQKGDPGATGSPGITGPAGPTGSTGPAGPASTAHTTALFTQPAVNATITVPVDSSVWCPQGSVVYITGGGYYQVSSVPDTTHLVLTNPGWAGAVTPGTTVPSGSLVSAGGAQGVTGPAGPIGPTGPPGTQGSPGSSAWTTVSTSFSVPAVGQSVQITVADATWVAVGEFLYVDTAGGSSQAAVLKCTAKSGNQITLTNVASQAGVASQFSVQGDGSSSNQIQLVNDVATPTNGQIYMVRSGARTWAAPKISTIGSLTGGGDLSSDRTFSLVGDVLVPPANNSYGTDANGNRGWQPSLIPVNRSITGVNSVTGGGDLSANRTLQLVGDVATPTPGQTYMYSNGAKKWLRPHGLNVADYGADSTGAADCTSVFQQAINDCSSIGRGIVYVPNGKYRFNGTLTIPQGVTLAGMAQGPFFVTPSTVQPVLLVTSGAGPFITLTSNSGLQDLAFFYPNQVQPSSSSPIAYPFTIVMTQGCDNAFVRRCTVVNAYAFLQSQGSRITIEDCNIGALLVGIQVDHNFDYSFIKKINFHVFWDEYYGAAYESTLDVWVRQNEVGIQLFHADHIMISDITAWGVNHVIQANDSPDTSLSIRCPYGQITNLGVEYCTYGVVAYATNTMGLDITDFTIQAGPHSQNAVYLGASGSLSPLVVISGGVAKGSFLGGYSFVGGGNLRIVDIEGYQDYLSATAGPLNPGNGVAAVIVGLNVPQGRWRIRGSVAFNFSGGGTGAAVGLNNSGALPGLATGAETWLSTAFSAGNWNVLNAGEWLVWFQSGSSVYAIIQAFFSGSATCYGFISAKREDA